MRWEIAKSSIKDEKNDTTIDTSRYKAMSWSDEKFVNIMTQRATTFLSPMMMSVYLPGSAMQQQHMKDGKYDLYAQTYQKN